MIVVTHTAVVQVLIHMEWIADPSIWAGLVTLVVIELVLGIDNLVFIAILAEKLPPAQRDRARITGLDAGDGHASPASGLYLLAGHPDQTADCFSRLQL